MTYHQTSLSLDRPNTPPSTALTHSTAAPAIHHSHHPSSPANNKSPRSPSNRIWVLEQQRKFFLWHLRRWSLDHDSSAYFHGKISLAPRAARSGESLELGKSVNCILADSAFTDARRTVVIRLFPPQRDKMHLGQGPEDHTRKDSMDPFNTRMLDIEDYEKAPEAAECLPHAQPQHGKHRSMANSYYKLVIRCGSGWMSARDYFSNLHFSNLHFSNLHFSNLHFSNLHFSNLHFSNLHTKKTIRPPSADNRILDEVLAGRSRTLGAPPQPADTVSIQPLFHPFTRLPPELQEHILFTATSLFGSYSMCHDSRLFPQPNSCSAQPIQSCISLSTLLRISRQLNRTLTPYIFAATTFHFGLTGFTNFLWQAGPSNRPLIRRLAFHLGKMALLHCTRWLAPDHVFELFQPPVVTHPRSLQYFWRCQIRDLAREVHLHTLTIDVSGIPLQDLGMVVRIFKTGFCSVERVRFVEAETETEGDGRVRELGEGDGRVKVAGEGGNWREMCRGYFENYKRHQFFMKSELLGNEGQALEEGMEGRREFDE